MCKAVLSYSKPIFFVAVRMMAAGCLLLASYRYRYGKIPAIKRVDIMSFVHIILFHIYCAYILDLWALQYLTSFKSSFFFNLAPFITAFFSYYFFNERITIKKALGFIIGFSGFLPELFSHSAQEGVAGGLLFLSWADVAMLVSVSSACYGWTVMRSMVRDDGYSPFLINGIGMLGGGILALITSYIVEDRWLVPPVNNIAAFVMLTALIILVINIIFYNFYGYLLRCYTATFLSFAGFMCPLFVALFGVFFLGETVGWTFYFSSAVVFLGLYIFYQEDLRQGYVNSVV